MIMYEYIRILRLKYLIELLLVVDVLLVPVLLGRLMEEDEVLVSHVFQKGGEGFTIFSFLRQNYLVNNSPLRRIWLI